MGDLRGRVTPAMFMPTRAGGHAADRGGDPPEKKRVRNIIGDPMFLLERFLGFWKISYHKRAVSGGLTRPTSYRGTAEPT